VKDPEVHTERRHGGGVSMVYPSATLTYRPLAAADGDAVGLPLGDAVAVAEAVALAVGVGDAAAGVFASRGITTSSTRSAATTAVAVTASAVGRFRLTARA
jgi:hypothetical protein